MPAFPAERFARAGATTTELDDLEARFDASSPAEQQSLLDRLAPVSDSEVAAMLDAYRGTEPAVEPDPEPEPDPDPPAVPSSSASSTSTSGGKSDPGSGE